MVFLVLFWYPYMVINVIRYSVQYSGPSFDRLSICRGPGSHSCFFLFFPFVSLVMSLFPSMESTPYVLSFRMVFFYLVATGCIFDISLYVRIQT